MAYSKFDLFPNSVVEVLMKAGLYGQFDPKTHDPMDGQPAAIPESTLNTIRPDGTTITHTMGITNRYDIKIFADQLDVKIKTQNPFVQYLFAKYAVELVNLMRGVNYISKSGFKGAVGSGNALDFLLLRAEQFADPELNTGAIATGMRNVGFGWARSVPGASGTAAPNTLQYICALDALGANNHGALTAGSTVATAEGIAILGFANPASNPCVSGYQPTYLGQQYNMQNLSFELADDEYGYPMVELPAPIFVWPAETVLINVRYFKNGIDELQPIGLWFKISNNMRALGTS